MMQSIKKYSNPKGTIALVLDVDDGPAMVYTMPGKILKATYADALGTGVLMYGGPEMGGGRGIKAVLSDEELDWLRSMGTIVKSFIAHFTALQRIPCLTEPLLMTAVIRFTDNPMPARRFQRIKELLRELESTAISLGMLSSQEDVQPLWDMIRAYQVALDQVKETTP